MLIHVVKSKIHRVKVTGADLNYIGSITIDEDLMDGHNDIWGDQIIGFISELITVSTTPQEVYEKLLKDWFKLRAKTKTIT